MVSVKNQLHHTLQKRTQHTTNHNERNPPYIMIEHDRVPKRVQPPSEKYSLGTRVHPWGESIAARYAGDIGGKELINISLSQDQLWVDSILLMVIILKLFLMCQHKLWIGPILY